MFVSCFPTATSGAGAFRSCLTSTPGCHCCLPGWIAWVRYHSPPLSIYRVVRSTWPRLPPMTAGASSPSTPSSPDYATLRYRSAWLRRAAAGPIGPVKSPPPSVLFLLVVCVWDGEEKNSPHDTARSRRSRSLAGRRQEVCRRAPFRQSGKALENLHADNHSIPLTCCACGLCVRRVLFPNFPSKPCREFQLS